MQCATLSIDGVAIRVPVGSMDPPTEFGEAVIKLIQNRDNWKMPTRKFVAGDIDKANEVGYALDWYMGGHEVEVSTEDGKVEFTVWSKGYYHHIGS